MPHEISCYKIIIQFCVVGINLFYLLMVLFCSSVPCSYSVSWCNDCNHSKNSESFIPCKASMFTAIFGPWRRAKPQLTTGYAAASHQAVNIYLRRCDIFAQEPFTESHDWAKPEWVFHRDILFFSLSVCNAWTSPTCKPHNCVLNCGSLLLCGSPG